MAAAATPLAAGLQHGGAAGQPQRLYWVPAVGLLPAIEHYRRETGLEGTAPGLPPLEGASEDFVAAAAGALERLGVSG